MWGRMLTRAQLVGRLAMEATKAGGQKAWAKQHSMSAAYVNDVLLSRKAPGAKILAALGYQEVVRYVPKIGE